MAAFFNTGLTQQQFLDEYWQKKPLLIRQAFTDFESPLTPEDLAGLACEQEIESRLIQEFGDDGSWQVRHGPMTEQDFESLPESHWTLLVQDVDKHLPETQTILDPFRFIPDWRRDDLMVSYAPENGSVGPHTDGYDVFLLQAMGQRRWQISDEAIADPDIIDSLPVQILSEFNPAQSWELHPGDMLYLPPHFAHHGVALNDCMTFSIGFRAPSQTDMLDAVVNGLLDKELAQGRYNDEDLLVSAQATEIDHAAVLRLKQLLHETIEQSEPILAELLGRYVSETKSSLLELAEQAMDEQPTVEDVEHNFEQGLQLGRNPYCRFAWTEADTSLLLFLAGEVYSIDKDYIAFMPMLTEAKQICREDWQQIKASPTLAETLCELIAEGGWNWQEN